VRQLEEAICEPTDQELRDFAAGLGDDVVEEVGVLTLRELREMWDDLDTSEDLAALARTSATSLIVDWLKRGAERDSLGVSYAECDRVGREAGVPALRVRAALKALIPRRPPALRPTARPRCVARQPRRAARRRPVRRARAPSGDDSERPRLVGGADAALVVALAHERRRAARRRAA